MESNKIFDLAKKQHPASPIVVQIHSLDVDVKEGISKATKNPYKISTQRAYLHSQSFLYPKEFQLNLDNHVANAVGHYVLDISKSIEFDNFGAMMINARNLQLLTIADF